MATELATDYLIVGSGAVGMAFADVIISETNKNVVIVDRFAKPGGHWNSAYPFVTLHQPSQFYGVSSRELSKGRIDEVGLNRGLSDLASGAEVSAYYDDVMRHTSPCATTAAMAILNTSFPASTSTSRRT